MDNEINISVIILTYNTPWESLYRTLLSVIYQEDIIYELIVSDDGSQENQLPEIEKILLARGVTNYTLFRHKNNIGTVQNLLESVKAAKGKYIKGIGAGDFLYDKHVLHDWINYMQINSSSVCFGDVVYFRNKKTSHISRQFEYPQFPNLYTPGKIKSMKRHYLLYEDLILGCKFIVERKTLQKYLEKISGRVKLAEDNIFRIMLCDNIEFQYYHRTVLGYEFGPGVWSSDYSSNKLQLTEDWIATNQILCTYCDNTFFGRRLKLKLDAFGKNFKLFNKLLFTDYYIFKIIKYLFPRYVKWFNYDET